MFRWLVAYLLLIVWGSVVASIPAAIAPIKSCREHPQLIAKCFSVHGRLSVYNGAPAVRIWRIGTRRMLGVSEQRFNLPEYRNIPESLASQINQDKEIFGDYLVCPFTRSKPGEMQLICIESAKNLVVRKRPE